MMNRAPRIPYAPLLLALVSCAHLRAPAEGGPAWRELVSPHFRLRTDSPPSDARRTLEKLEQTYAAFELVTDLRCPGGPGASERVEVTLFDSRSAFRSATDYYGPDGFALDRGDGRTIVADYYGLDGSLLAS